MARISFTTLGCKVNQYETEAMREALERAGHEIVELDADVAIVNTCTVTNIADQKSRHMLRRFAEEGTKVIATGCLAQRDPEKLMAIEGVCAVAGVSDRANIADIVAGVLAGEAFSEPTVAGVAGYENMSIERSSERTRAHMKIEDGCNNFCSYCIIPYARGRVRSRSLADIRAEARRLERSGAKEVVVTGIHLCSYGLDTGSDLIQALEAARGDYRIRLGSMEPSFLTEAHIAALAEIDELCPHFHVSMQSGCTSVLKRMNRRYTAEEYARSIELLRNYFDEPAITTDVIAGFPGETDEEHAETMAFVKDIGFARLHVFPYSRREGTKASKMKDVPKAIRKARASELIEAGDAMEKAYLASRIGKTETVLMEEDGCGYSERYCRIYTGLQSRELVKVSPTRLEGNLLYID